jgi:2,3-bisphosphoglycerate-dependent phosphoglycerate mutase
LPDPETRVVLIRHGEAQVAVEGIIGGSKGCTGLSDLGRRQAAALRDRLRRTGELAGAAHLYASTLPRAIETAEIVGEALGLAAPETDCDLCEIHPGDELDGMRWEDYAKQYRTEEFRYDVFVPWGPGVETWAEFSFRTSRRLRKLVADHAGETVVVVCHGGVIRVSMQAFGGLSLEHSLGLEPINTSLTEWVHRPDSARYTWWLHRYNDAAHLADLETAADL